MNNYLAFIPGKMINNIHEDIILITAKDMIEAKQVSMLYARLQDNGMIYNENGIYVEKISNITSDDYFYTIENMREIYEKSGKEFILPEIEENEDDEDGEKDS